MPISWPDNPMVTVLTVVDVLVVAILLYNFVLVLRGRRAMAVLSGMAVLVGIYVISVWLRMALLRSLLANLAPYAIIAFIVLFQSELRGYLTRLGRVRWARGGWISLSGRLERREIVDEIVSAVEHMAEKRTGALIVMERDIGLRTFIESGVTLDASVSRDLLLAIFHPGAQLHDGAVILQGDRIAAAACFLPLHVHPAGAHGMALRKMGTRHRAAIGVTEGTDALAVVVSEETGQISIAWRGELEADISLDRLRERLTHHSTGARHGEERSGEAQLGSVQP
jgi:diadenylate cyclase